MQIGDLVRKKSSRQKGETGVIIKMVTNTYTDSYPDVTIVTVLCSKGTVQNWYSEYVEVISESR